MLNLDTKTIKNYSDKDAKMPMSPFFTLKDTIKLLQSTKNVSKEDISKIQNKKISLSDKKLNMKTFLNFDKNVFPIKGNSIFNNSILYNLLRTTTTNNPNEQQQGENKTLRKNETNAVYSNESLNKEFNSGFLGISKICRDQNTRNLNCEKDFKIKLHSVLDEVKKKEINFNEKENIYCDRKSNDNDSNSNRNNKKNNEEFIYTQRIIKGNGNLYINPIGHGTFNNNINSDDDLRFSYEISKSRNNRAAEVQQVSFLKNIHVMKQSENKNSDINKNAENKMHNRVIQINNKIDNNDFTNCEFNNNSNNHNHLQKPNTLTVEEKSNYPNIKHSKYFNFFIQH